MYLKHCKVLIIFFFILLGGHLFSQTKLSNDAKVSLITGGAGGELYNMYGHSAISIKDDNNNIDYIFNFGTFDFSTPNFVTKFIRGTLKYFLGIDKGLNYFVAFYKSEGRSVYEQVLSLTPKQKQAIFDHLIHIYQSDERFYQYDFFHDNCATRIRDVFKKVLGKRLQFNGVHAEKRQSFRALLMPYLKEKPWLGFGIHLLLGSPSDKIASEYQYMYLPFHLKDAFEKATLLENGKTIPLVKKELVLFKGVQKENKTVFFSPLVAFTLFFVFIVTLTLFEQRLGKIFFTIDFLLFFVAGLLGIFFLFLWFGTVHKVLPWNLNMLWAFPLHSIVSFFLLFKSKKAFLKNYFLINNYILGFTIFSWFIFLPQYLPYALFPLVLAYFLRSFKLYQYFTRR